MTMPQASAPASSASRTRTPLASLKRERVLAPHLIYLFGLYGIGKTGLAAQFPDPIFLSAEKAGAYEQLVARWPDAVTSWADVLEMIERLTVEEHSFKT